MKAGAKVLNVFWVIFVGIYSTIVSCIIGAICCVTIIGIPFGVQYFKFTKLAIAPAGKRVVSHFKTRPVLNVLWLIFGGLEAYILLALVGIICAITVIGFPLAMQLYKIANYFVAPFGAEIVNDGEYSKDRKDLYDYEILSKRIVANPQVVITEGEQANKTVGQYLVENYKTIDKDYAEVIEKQQKRSKVTSTIFTIVVMVYMLLVYFIVDKTGWVNLSEGQPMEWVKLIGIAILSLLPLMTIMSLFDLAGKRQLVAHKHKYYSFLIDYYPVGSPEKKKLKLSQKEIGLDGKSTGKLRKELDIIIEEIQKDFPEYYNQIIAQLNRKIVAYDAHTGQPIYEGQVIIGYNEQTGAPIYGDKKE